VVRYDLGSGAVLIKSADKLQLNGVHTVLVRRFGRDGSVRVDSGVEVSASSPGLLRSLDVSTPLFVGYLPNTVSPYVTSTLIRRHSNPQQYQRRSGDIILPRLWGMVEVGTG